MLCRSFLLLAILVGCGVSRDEGFKVIHVDDLAAMQGAGRRVTVLDANRAEFRAKEGIIPGATLLSSYSKYDVEKELPPEKDAGLVFYCADTH